MEASELKSGIARYLLAHISKNISSKLASSPFAKVIKLPQMLGHSEHDMKAVFNVSGVNCFWKQNTIDSWAPQSREYSTCTFVDGSLVQFGGLSTKMMNDVNIFDLRTFKWTHISFEKEEYVPEPRYGHSAICYGSLVVIYGGYRRFLKSLKLRDTHGDISYFCTDTLKWDKPICKGKTIFRRHHTAALMGHLMVVQGGINEKAEEIDLPYTFNFITSQWKELESIGETPGKISHHACCSISTKINKRKRSTRSVLLFPNKVIDKEPFNNQVYYFGGRNSDSTVTVLKPHFKHNFEWVKLSISGQSPETRYSHSMEYFEWIKSIVIFGGRVDSNRENKITKSKLLNDLWMLNIVKNQWVKVTGQGSPPKTMYAHNSAVYGSQLIIFGGITDHKTQRCSMELQLNETTLNICELHQQRANLLKRQRDVIILLKNKKKRKKLDIKAILGMPGMQVRDNSSSRSQEEAKEGFISMQKTLHAKQEKALNDSCGSSPRRSSVMDKIDRVEQMIFNHDFE
ncbi:unnamed protein product [Moneuplotes crassus]|uniref:Uncharacterized protein n=1 Tax=Euplotes crassus TaxID=5936 RepID=A0AAD1U5B1_EUPCR|nr:unnamed protein product [Moneuplotes crassus]